MKIDYSPLENVFGQLQKSYGYLHSDLAPDLREQFRSASIQEFEFTYRLAIGMIRRQLAQIIANPAELHRISFDDLMWNAANAGIIRDARAYMIYRDIRNTAPHAYNAEQAENIVTILYDFRSEINFLLERLRERNRATD